MSRSRSLGSNGECCFWPSAFTAAGTNCGRSVPLCGALHPSERLQVRLTAKWRMGRDWSREATCLTARTTNVDFGFLPSPLRGRPLVGLCRCAALFIPPRSFKFAGRRNGGWGGIACAALRLFAYGLSSAGAFGSRCSTCLTARTALFIPPRGFKRLRRNGGWGGIRTLGALLHTRFPSVRIRPLCHPS